MRWIFRLLGAVVVLVVLAVAAVFLLPAEKIAGVALGKLETLTGRKVTLEGSVRPSVWPVLGVETGPVSMANADWSDAGPMFRAEALEIGVDLAALIGGEVKITKIAATGPKLVLERAKDGRENWVFGGSNGGSVTTNTPGVGQPFTLDKGVITGGALTFVDHGTGQRFDLTDMDMTLAVPEYEGKATVEMRAARGGQAFALNAEIGAFRTFLDGRLGALSADWSAGKATAEFKGRAGWNPMAAEGTLKADLGALTEVSAVAGIPAPSLPKGLGAGGVAVAGQVTLTEAGSVHLRKGTVTLDGAPLSVDADMTTAGARPKLSAQVTAGALDLSGMTGGSGGGAQGGAKATGWPKDRIDASGLGALDAEVALTADSLDLGLAKFGAVQAMVTIDRARAVFDLRRATGYDGTIAGQFVVNARKGLSVGGDLTFAGLQLQPLLQDFGGYDRLIGTGDLRVKFLGSGSTVDAIMHSLEGQGTLSLTKGELRGLDVAGMLRTLDTGYVGEGQKTIFDSVAGSFVMKAGDLFNDDLALVSPYVTASGQGRVGLGARDLEYRIKATALADDQGQGGLTAPLLISGTWAKPKFSLDLEALAQERLDEQKAKLEAEAEAKAAELRAKAKEKLKDELGIEQLPDESLEDAAKRKLNEAVSGEAQKALEDLLGGN
jgi:AsmA protein